ncbi:hypothetical protein [Sphingomonas sp.]
MKEPLEARITRRIAELEHAADAAGDDVLRLGTILYAVRQLRRLLR